MTTKDDPNVLNKISFSKLVLRIVDDTQGMHVVRDGTVQYVVLEGHAEPLNIFPQIRPDSPVLYSVARRHAHNNERIRVFDASGAADENDVRELHDVEGGVFVLSTNASRHRWLTSPFEERYQQFDIGLEQENGLKTSTQPTCDPAKHNEKIDNGHDYNDLVVVVAVLKSLMRQKGKNRMKMA
ncbi:MAG: hypothetical protein Q9174_006348 [Haloplaca sp. 1 TL-2023]